MHLNSGADAEGDELSFSMLRLSIQGEGEDETRQRKARSSFRFFDLPYEIRSVIYELALLRPGRLIDLQPDNYRFVSPRLQLLLVSKLMRAEAAAVFFGRQAFHLFPQHGRFFYTKLPLLARLSPHDRAEIRTMEMRLGPGWGAPPRCQVINDKLGLEDCVRLRTLRVFVEVDPSQDVFNGFRGKGKDKESYREFCVGLLMGVCLRVPSLEVVEIDAYPSVGKDSPLIGGLVKEVERQGRKLVWGPLRGWEHKEDCGQLGLERALAGMCL